MVYANDIFWGRNKSLVLQRYLCSRNAEHDEVLSVLLHIKSLQSVMPWKVMNMLRADAKRGSADNGPHLPAVYVRYRGTTAKRLESVPYIVANTKPVNSYSFMNAWASPGYSYKPHTGGPN